MRGLDAATAQPAVVGVELQGRLEVDEGLHRPVGVLHPAHDDLLVGEAGSLHDLVVEEEAVAGPVGSLHGDGAPDHAEGEPGQRIAGLEIPGGSPTS